MANEIVIERLVIPIEGDTSGLERDFAQTKTMAGTWATALGNIVAEGFLTLVRTAADLAVGAVNEVLDVVGEGVDVAKDFESSLADLSIAAGNSGLSFQELHDAAIAVGGDTNLLGVSASGAAESMVNLYKAGLTTSQVFGDVESVLDGTASTGGALRASIDLAAASELDMVQAAELAATTIATFGGQAEEAGQSVDEWIVGALDNFVKSADASVADVSDLTAALGAVGPTAAAFGFSLEDTNNALAILSTRGIKGAEAGTALKSMLTNIMRPTNQVKDALSDLNVSLFNTDGTMRDLPTIIGDFEQALMGVNETTTITGGRTKEQQAELERLQGVYNRTAASIRDYESGVKGVNLTEEKRAEKLTDLQAVLANAGEAMADLETIQGTAVSSMAALTEEQRNAAVQTLAGTFGMKAMQTLMSEGIEGWDAMAMATADAMGTQEQAAIKADTLAGALEGLDGVKETLMIGIGEGLLPVLTDLSLWAQDMAADYGPLVVDFFAELGDKASTLFGILGETDFATIFGDLAEFDFSSLAEFLSLLGIDLELPWLETVATFFAETLPAAIEATTSFVTGELLPRLQLIWSMFTTYVLPVLMQVYDWFAANIPVAIGIALEVFAALSDWWVTNWPIIQAVALTAWEIIQGVVLAVVDVIVNQVWPNLQEAFALIEDTLASLGISWADIWNAIKTAIGIVAAFIGVTILFVIGVIVGLVNGVTILIANLIEVFFDLWANIAGIFEGIVMALTGAWEFIQGIFTGNQEQIIAGARAFGLGVWLTISRMVRTVVQLFVGLGVSVLEAVAGLIAGVIGFFVELYTSLLGGEDSEIVKMIDGIIDLFTETDWLQLGKDIIDGIGEGISNAATGLAKKAAEAAKAALDAAKAFLGIDSPSRVAAEQIGEPFGEGVGVGIEESANAVMDSIDSLFAEVIPRVNQEAVQNIKEGDTYQLDANYAYQDERTLIDQVRFLQLEQAVPMG